MSSCRVSVGSGREQPRAILKPLLEALMGAAQAAYDKEMTADEYEIICGRLLELAIKWADDYEENQHEFDKQLLEKSFDTR